MNQKRTQDELNTNNYKLNKYLEEKSSERNALEDDSQKLEKRSNLDSERFNKKDIISDINTIIEINENEKDNNVYFNKTKRKNMYKNNILGIKFSDKNSEKLYIKNKKKNLIEININRDVVDNILSIKKINLYLKLFK